MNAEGPGLSPAAPRFSVIMPVFNGQRFVAEAIHSVLDQRYPAEEIIVIDDGSTDRTPEVVGAISTTVPLRYFRQNNQGPAAARNNGAALAHGDWLAFLDTDDIWRDDKLLVQADYIVKNPEAVMLWCSFDCVDNAGQPTPALKQKDPFRELLFQSTVFPIPSTTVVRKDAFDTVDGFDPELRRYEDAELFLRIAVKFPTRYIGEQLIHYRLHPQQRSRAIREKAQYWPLMQESMSKICHGDRVKMKALNDLAARTHSFFGKHYLRGGEVGEARRHFRLSFRHKPLGWSNLRRWMLSYVAPLRAAYRRSKKHAVRA